MEAMPLIQVRDVPAHIHRLLAENAARQRRSLAQEVVTVLARGLEVELDAKARRRRVLRAIQSGAPMDTRKLRGPARLIREDRQR